MTFYSSPLTPQTHQNEIPVTPMVSSPESSEQTKFLNVQDYHDRVLSLENENFSLKILIRNLMKDLDGLKNYFQTTHGKFDNSFEGFKQLLIEKEEQISHLTSELANTIKASESPHIKQQVSDLLSENSKLRSMIEEQSHGTSFLDPESVVDVTALKAEVDKLKKENQDLLDQLQSTNQHFQELNELNENNQVQIENLKQQNEELLSQKTKMEEKINDLNIDDLDSLISKLETLTKENQDLKEEIGKIKKQQDFSSSSDDSNLKQKLNQALNDLNAKEQLLHDNKAEREELINQIEKFINSINNDIDVDVPFTFSGAQDFHSAIKEEMKLHESKLKDLKKMILMPQDQIDNSDFYKEVLRILNDDSDRYSKDREEIIQYMNGSFDELLSSNEEIYNEEEDDI